MRKGKESTLMTTEVTPLSMQKYVSDLRAYCSENFLMISTDFSDGSTTYANNTPMKLAISVKSIDQLLLISLI